MRVTLIPASEVWNCVDTNAPSPILVKAATLTVYMVYGCKSFKTKVSTSKATTLVVRLELLKP